ncbi:MAG: threonine synthase [Acidiferrobacterales bacterium]
MSVQKRYTGIIDRYREHLPLRREARVVSLCEGDTPLIRLHAIPANLGREVEIYAKYEGVNPTGSFKDRGMTVAVTQAVDDGSRAIVCASTGNTSASAAAYAARAGISCFVIIPEGKITLGKLAQATMHGAVVIQIEGNFDDGMRLVKEVANEAPVTVVNSINPYRLHGQKTLSFEVVDALGAAPDYHCLPVGNAGNISSHWMGYCEYADKGLADSRPVMCGYQAAGAAPFVLGHKVEQPETLATAIRIGNPQSWDKAWSAQKESTGWFDKFTDDEILQTQRLLAQNEGIFCEPASAVSVAGAMRDLLHGKIPQGKRIVCTLTGHGLKDPDTAIKQSTGPMLRVRAELSAIKKAIVDHLT